jgi:hypothetical protein
LRKQGGLHKEDDLIKREKNNERLERKQNKIDAGILSDVYPNMNSIVIRMNYYHKHSDASYMQRTINFYPQSAAYFHMECMKSECTNGGFDLGPAISKMSKKRITSDKGEMQCRGNGEAGHVHIDYSIAIKYSKSKK